MIAMRKPFYLVALTCGLYADDSICPRSIDVKQAISTVPSGWAVEYETTGNTLTQVTFFDGPPSEKASLVYDRYVKSKTGKDTATWTFSPQSKYSHYIACRYNDTSATLSRKLPDNTTECKVVYDSKSGNAIQSIVCK